MSTAASPWRASTVLLAAAGVIVAGIGIYFIILRPALLPEDIRYMQLSPTELFEIGPRLGAWLTQVFRVLGGYALATGILAIALAATAFRRRQRTAVIAVVFGGAASIGLMAAVNFAIDSDFKWLLFSFALVWAMSLLAYWLERRTDRLPSPTRPHAEGNRP